MASLRSWFRGGSSSTNPAKTPSSGPSPAASQSGLNDSNAGTPSTSQADELEAAEIEDAMAVAGMIMNDDIDGAEALLRERKDPSSFHLLVMGVAAFMKSILGFEKEVMAEASNRLAECETRAWADLKRAQREADKAAGGGSYWYGRAAAAAATGDGAKAGHVFPPGSEFALVHAEAQLMSAVVAIMHESLTDAVRGFYKLRKAFLTLDGIMESEAKALGQLKDGVGGGGGGGAAAGAAASPPKRPRMSEDVMPGSFDETEFAEFEERNGRGSDSDADFVDAAAPSKPASASASRPSTPAVEKAVADLSLTSTSTSTSASQTAASDVSAAGSHGSGSRTPSSVRRLETKAASQPPLAAASSSSALGRVPTSIDPGVFTATRDVFVHSGVNMCFGALLLVISMVPPAFSRLLQIVGFKGDREKGIRMLWQSTKFPNINGAVAGLLVLGYYNGLLTFADILPGDRDVEELAAAEDEGVVGYPKERCLALLADMRARYPASGLWKLEEARVLSSTRRLREAIEVMAGNDTSKMRQVVALNKFELSLNAMYVMDWPLMRDSFLHCVELNEWSHSIYYYLVACAELEQYRDARRAGEASEAGRHKRDAEGYLRKVPALAGRKRFLARQMPMEVFVCRKVQKFEERAAALKVDLADAVGVSPTMEMVYLWNGSKKMPAELLERARGLLAWERCTTSAENVARIRDEKDEAAVAAVSEAALLRSLGRLDDCRAKLAPILEMDKSAFKGSTKDDYALPSAYYEKAAAAWVESSDPQYWPAGSDEEIDAFRRALIDECQTYLEKVAKWESYAMDARLGMRVQTGLDSVRWLKARKSWA